MNSTLVVFISGLGSERTGPGEVMRAWGARMMAMLKEQGAALYVAYMTPRIAELVADRAGEFERLVLIGHSDGGSIIKHIADVYAEWMRTGKREVVVDLAVLLDPAPDFARGQVYFWQVAQWCEWARWKLPVDVVRRSVCFYQRRQSFLGLVGLCGCPIRTVPGVHTNADVTDWEPPRLGHNEIPGDARIQEIVNGLVWDVANQNGSLNGGAAL